MSERSFLPARDREPDATVAVGAAGSKTFADLLRDVAKVQTCLEAERGSGSEVLVLCEDRYYASVCLLATWQAGLCVASPPNFESATLQALVESSEVRSVLTDQRRAELAKEHVVQGVLAEGAEHGARPLHGISAERRIAALYTSGTTGRQQRADKHAAQLLGEAADAALSFDFSAGEVVLPTTPSHHIYGMLFGVLVPLAGGARFVRETPFHSEAIARVAGETGATTLVSVPAHLGGLAQREPDERWRVRRIFSSAAPLRTSVAASLVPRLAREIVELFGSTETGGIAWRSLGDGALEPAWRALPTVRVSQSDEGLLELESPYADGGVSRKHTSADHIELYPDGTFRHAGRRDGIVKVGGKRVALQHIEEEALTLPGVSDASAIAVDVSGLRGTEIWLAVASTDADVAKIHAALARRFDAVVVPRRIRVVLRLPRNEGGKLTREALLLLFEGRASKTERA